MTVLSTLSCCLLPPTSHHPAPIVQPPDCDPSRDCGSWVVYPYFISFVVLVSIIMLQLFTAVIIESFEAQEEQDVSVWKRECLCFVDQLSGGKAQAVAVYLRHALFASAGHAVEAAFASALDLTLYVLSEIRARKGILLHNCHMPAAVLSLACRGGSCGLTTWRSLLSCGRSTMTAAAPSTPGTWRQCCSGDRVKGPGCVPCCRRHHRAWAIPDLLRFGKEGVTSECASPDK